MELGQIIRTLNAQLRFNWYVHQLSCVYRPVKKDAFSQKITGGLMEVFFLFHTDYKEQYEGETVSKGEKLHWETFSNFVNVALEIRKAQVSFKDFPVISHSECT